MGLADAEGLEELAVGAEPRVLPAVRLVGDGLPVIAPGQDAESVDREADAADFRLSVDLVPKALDTLEFVMTSEKAPFNSRVAAAKVVLEAVKARKAAGLARDVHEMSAAELEAERSRLLGELSARATLIIEADAVATADAAAAGGIFD